MSGTQKHYMIVHLWNDKAERRYLPDFGGIVQMAVRFSLPEWERQKGGEGADELQEEDALGGLPYLWNMNGS